MCPMLVQDQLATADAHRFRGTQPFPWLGLCECLRPDAFAELLETFPSIDRFIRHEGIAPAGILRPHDRWYLAYDARAGAEAGSGVAGPHQLSPAWRAFIAELLAPAYQHRIRDLFGVRFLTTRFAWHLAGADDEVSPHLDAPRKVGTHLFYFNTLDDWNPAWGGATLLLGEPRADVAQPDFDDFATAASAPFTGNHSLMFRNGPTAWHGVRRLSPDARGLRRLFTVVFDHPRYVHIIRTVLTKARRRIPDAKGLSSVNLWAPLPTRLAPRKPPQQMAQLNLCPRQTKLVQG